MWQYLTLRQSESGICWWAAVMGTKRGSLMVGMGVGGGAAVRVWWGAKVGGTCADVGTAVGVCVPG